MRHLCLHTRVHPGTFLSLFACQLILICAVGGLLSGCALPNPETLVSPTPIQGASGKFLNPYLANGKLAPWADKGVHSDRTAAGMGAFAATEAVGLIDPTGFAASGTGTLIKQQGAISAAGGQEYMKSTSDTSFNRHEDVAVYLYVNHSTKELYKKTLELMGEIYPDVGSNYDFDIRSAPKKPTIAPVKGAG